MPTIEFAANGPTAQSLNTWFARVSSGLTDQRFGEIHLLRPSLTADVATFQLFDITPVTLMPYGVGPTLRRTAVFSLSRFQLQ